MYKNSHSNQVEAGGTLAAAISQEVEAHFDAVLPSIEAIVRKVVSTEIAPLLEKENKIPVGKMTRTQFCERYNVSMSTLVNLINSGVLHPCRIGSRVLIDSDEVEEKLASGELAKYKRRNK